MKKLNKKLRELAKLSQNGSFESFIDSLDAQELGNFLHYIDCKKRAIIASSINKEIGIENQIHEAKEGTSSLKISFLKDDIMEVKMLRDAEIEFWEKIEKKMKEKKKVFDKKREKRIKSKTQ